MDWGGLDASRPGRGVGLESENTGLRRGRDRFGDRKGTCSTPEVSVV